MPVRIIQNNFTSGVISELLFGRTDLSKYGNGLEKLQNFIPQVYGGIKTRPGMKYLGNLDDLAAGEGVRCIPFVFNSSQSYVLVFTDLNMRIMKDGGFVVYPAGHPSEGDVVEIVSPYAGAHLPTLKYTQITDTMRFTHTSYTRRKLVRTDHHLWTFSAVAEVVATAPVYNNVTVVPTVGASTRAYTYGVSAVNAAGVESAVTPFPVVPVDSPWTAGQYVQLIWYAATGAVTYRIYKDSHGTYGLIGEVLAPTLIFVDDNIAPSTTYGAPIASTKFLTSNDYPGAVGVYEQRVVHGGSINQPQTVIASQTALLDNFRTTQFGQDTDALEYSLFSQLSENILHFVSLESLLIFTSESEKIMTHGSNSDALTPTSVSVKTRSRYGSSDVPPVVVGNDVIFVQREGKRVLNFFYALEADGYESNDLNIMNPDIFGASTVRDWTWDNANEILWVITFDGYLYSLTYNRKQQVWAWAKHVTSGTPMAIGCIYGTSGSEIYIVVQRSNEPTPGSIVTTFGMELFYEGVRTAPETSFCVDSGLEYAGVAVDTVSGLDHLVGRDVAVLADGGVVPNITVAADGTITIPYEATKIIVGLPIACIAKPVRVNINAQGSTVQGAFKLVNKIVMRVINTRGLTVSLPHNGTTVAIEVKPRSTEAYGDPSELQSGDVPLNIFASWDRDGQVEIKQDYPLPAHITAIMSEVEFED